MPDRSAEITEEMRPGELSEQAVWLSVYSPVFDETAKAWEFTLGGAHFSADISETSIAKDALERGGAMVNDKYQVRLQISRVQRRQRQR